MKGGRGRPDVGLQTGATSGISVTVRMSAERFRVQGSGFKVQGSECRVEVSEFRVQGSEFRVQGSSFRVQGSGCRVQISGFRVARGSEVACDGEHVVGGCVGEGGERGRPDVGATSGISVTERMSASRSHLV